jgi:uroporphyrinogen-III decarboxylase
MLFLALDQPEMFEQLLDIVHGWDKRNIEILLDSPVEFVTRRGWYEGTAFWSPALFRRYFQPRFKELTDMVRQADRLIGYKNSTGFMPLLDAFVEIGYDAHIFIDPVMGGAGTDLHKVKATFENKIAVVGGVNSAVTLERGSREIIRQAVFAAVDTLGPGGGLVLTPVDCISASTPWESIEILIEAWKEVRDYPL